MRFGLFYQASEAEGQTHAERYAEMIDSIALGDTLGFDVAWLAELHFGGAFSLLSSPLMLVPVIAQRTPRIRVGTAVTLLPLHHPLACAEQAATADVLSGGRLEFGVGRGSIPSQFHGFRVAVSENRARFDESVALLVEQGAEVVEVSCPNFDYALAAYYLILPSEASSNLAKFDAMRYGLRVLPEGVDAPTAEQVMAVTREAGFGAEVKRRIILGTYALSSGYYDAYYGSAQKVRTLIQRDFDRAYEQVDVLVSPTAPTTAFRLGDKLDDPMAMYLNDIATIPANLAGVPGMSIPSGLADEDGLPTGIQVLAPATKDERLYTVGAALEQALLERWGAPILSKAPELAGGAGAGARAAVKGA